MAILVICPGCRSRFQVSDQFAGKTGVCPKCKASITIPGKDEEVKIGGVSGLEELADGGKNVAGQFVPKPIARQEGKLRTGVAIAILVGTVSVLGVAWLAGPVLQHSLTARTLGLLLIAPPLTLGAYSVLHDDELESYQGKDLFYRTAICSLAYVGLWGIFAYVHSYGMTEDFFSWFYVALPFVILGALTSLACYDLDFGNACFHYGFFLLVTVLLARLTGIGWIWQI